MFKIFADIKENVSEACRKSKRTFQLGVRQGAIKAFAEAQLKALKKATPRSDRTEEHAADDWEIEYDKEGMFIVGFEVTNPHERIDWIEYGTKRPEKKLITKQAEEGKTGDRIYPKHKKCLHFFWNGEEVFASSVKGSEIKPMGFVREIQEEMTQGMSARLKKVFDVPIEEHWD